MYPNCQLQVDELGLIRGERLLFKQLNFSIKNGQALQIRGVNGAGKTSLLRVVCGLLEPDRGSVLFNGENLAGQHHQLHQHLCYLGHQLGLKRQLSVQENLSFYQRLRAAPANHDIDQAIKTVGLDGYQNQRVAHLSQGQQRRVALARLVVEPAAVWVLDEPFVALDVDGQAWLGRLFAEHLANQGLIVFTSHQSLPFEFPVSQLEMGVAA